MAQTLAWDMCQLLNSTSSVPGTLRSSSLGIVCPGLWSPIPILCCGCTEPALCGFSHLPRAPQTPVSLGLTGKCRFSSYNPWDSVTEPLPSLRPDWALAPYSPNLPLVWSPCLATQALHGIKSNWHKRQVTFFASSSQMASQLTRAPGLTVLLILNWKEAHGSVQKAFHVPENRQIFNGKCLFYSTLKLKLCSFVN